MASLSIAMAMSNQTEKCKVLRRAGRQIRAWLERVKLALERVEKHIVDTFKVPPGG